jgi:hypothetical protein
MSITIGEGGLPDLGEEHAGAEVRGVVLAGEDEVGAGDADAAFAVGGLALGVEELGAGGV